MGDSDKHKIIILAAPSGAGKTTIKSRLLANMPNKLSFSISAATRKIRVGEQDGVDYFFISVEDFKNKIKELKIYLKALQVFMMQKRMSLMFLKTERH